MLLTNYVDKYVRLASYKKAKPHFHFIIITSHLCETTLLKFSPSWVTSSSSLMHYAWKVSYGWSLLFWMEIFSIRVLSHGFLDEVSEFLQFILMLLMFHGKFFILC
jgi:hypothetical protein